MQMKAKGPLTQGGRNIRRSLCFVSFAPYSPVERKRRTGLHHRTKRSMANLLSFWCVCVCNIHKNTHEAPPPQRLNTFPIYPFLFLCLMISSRSAFLKKKMATNFQVAKILRFSLAFHKFLSSWFTHITHQIAQSRPLATGRIVPSSFLLCGEENESRKRFLLILSSQDEKFIHYCYDSDHSPFLKLNISAEDSPFF